MSFFQKMMRLQQDKPAPKLEVAEIEEDYHEEETAATANQRDNHLILVKNQISHENDLSQSQQKTQQSRKVTVRFIDESQEWEDIGEQSKPMKVYKLPKVNLITALLPKKQQMLREMIAKKKEFQLKKSSQLNRQTELQLKLAESSYKFKNIVSQKQVNSQQIKQNQQQQDSVSIVSIKSSKNRPQSTSSNKPPSCPSAKQSRYSSNVSNKIKQNNIIEMSSPQGDTLNKQIMMRLLSLLQNERHDRNSFMNMNNVLAMSGHHQNIQASVAHPRQKQTPIIINNIMKTPMESINRDIMERQMKIKIMENNRYNRNNQSSSKSICSNSAKNNKWGREQEPAGNSIKLTSKLSKRFDQDDGNLNSERSNTHMHDNQTFQLSANSKNSKIQQNQESISAQNSRRTNKNNVNIHNKKNQSNGKTRIAEINCFGKDEPSQSTANNSSENSQVREFKADRVRHYDQSKKTNMKKIKINQNQPTDPKKQEIEDNSQSSRQYECKGRDIISSMPNITAIHKQPIRAPVLMEIPLGDNLSKGQGMTLAEAFKRKIGRLKSQRAKEDKENKSPLKKNKESDNKAINKGAGINISLTQIYSEYTSQKSDLKIDLSSLATNKMTLMNSETLNQNKKTPQNQNSSKMKSNRSAMIEKSQEKKLLKQPSKQLIDRLIYGQRAKISKKDMYALTRKNYDNLPQVQQKKKQQQKKRLQQQRLLKIKEYQRNIRSNKSIKKQ